MPGCFAALLAFAACERKPAIEVLTPPSPADQLQQTYWKLPDFTLTERNGKPVSLADLKGKVWVADFFYTTCPGPCPILSSRLSELQKQLATDDRVRLVSISTDPETDTPEVLGEYARRFKARDHWLFLTGSKEAIRSLARDGFKLPIAENPGTPEPIIHSARLILIDRTGTIRGLYDAIGGDDPAEILRDIRRLLDSPP